jgi:hypothetical protein
MAGAARRGRDEVGSRIPGPICCRQGGKAPYQEDERDCIGDLTTDEEEAPGVARPSLAHVAQRDSGPQRKSSAMPRLRRRRGTERRAAYRVVLNARAYPGSRRGLCIHLLQPAGACAGMTSGPDAGAS